MRLKEQRVWDSMKRNIDKRLWCRRIENEVGAGEADVWVGMKGDQTWVELKSIILPKKATTKLMGDEGLRISQINWHLKMASLGLRTYVLIRDNALRLYLIEGKYADVMNDFNMTEMQLHNEADNWEDISQCLLKE